MSRMHSGLLRNIRRFSSNVGMRFMGRTKTALATILAQLPAARARSRRANADGRQAVSVRYDLKRERFIVELTQGYLFGFPASAIPSLIQASVTARRDVHVSPGGGALYWPGLDVDLSVPGLLLETVPQALRRKEWARTAGRSTSPAKVAAARLNGKKGGRPRKKAHP
jgi:hypothetical protein